MTNSRANSLGWSDGDTLTAAQANALDDGQVAALCRGGTTTTTSACTISSTSYAFTITATGQTCTLTAATLVLTGTTTTMSGTTCSASYTTVGVTASGTCTITAATLALSIGTSWPTLSSRTITDHAVPYSIVGGNYTLGTTGENFTCFFTNDSYTIKFALFLPQGMTLTSVKLGVLGETSGTLPGTMPSMTLKRFSATSYGTAAETVGSATDTSANNAAYTVEHDITISGLTHAVVQGSHYILEYTNAAGLGSDNNSYVFKPFITGTLAVLRTA